MEYVFLLGITGILSGNALGKKDYGFFIVFFLMAAFYCFVLSGKLA